MATEKEIEELNNKILNLSIYRKIISEYLLKYNGLANEIINIESINKSRRYGSNEYKNRFVNNVYGNISSYMREYSYVDLMSGELKKLYIGVDKEISKSKKKKLILGLDNE